MNTEKPKRKSCACGQEFTVETRNQRSCPACIEAREVYEAARPRPLRTCKECGAESRECQYKLCPTCLAADNAKREQENQAWQARWKEERKQQQLEKLRRDREAKNQQPSAEEKPAPMPAPTPPAAPDDEDNGVGDLAMALIKRVGNGPVKPDGELTMRMYFPQELDALFWYNGFAIEHKYGDSDRRPFDAQSSMQHYILKRR